MQSTELTEDELKHNGIIFVKNDSLRVRYVNKFIPPVLVAGHIVH